MSAASSSGASAPAGCAAAPAPWAHEPVPDRSRQGRDLQRYADTGERLVAGCVALPLQCCLQLPLDHNTRWRGCCCCCCCCPPCEAAAPRQVFATRSPLQSPRLAPCLSHPISPSPSLPPPQFTTAASQFATLVPHRPWTVWRCCSSPAVVARAGCFQREAGRMMRPWRRPQDARLWRRLE